MNIAYLNFNNLKLHEVKTKISRAIDDLMTLHRNHKGIIHTTSYKQLNFIKENISQTNKRRLLMTDPDVPRDEVISEHTNSIKPTVLISPSLHLGLDLKDDLSRFQIITKVPYPDLGDRWINEKRKIYEQWYIWQTPLRLVQAYGRSIRSKEDWAKTYVLDSAFGLFVKNKSILPHWFIQAIQAVPVKSSLGHAASDTEVLTTAKENHNEITNNHHHPTNLSEKNKISFYIPIKPSKQSGTSANLDNNTRDESKRPEQLFICRYCRKYNTKSSVIANVILAPSSKLFVKVLGYLVF
jgi:hypothetical protein